MTTAEKVDTRVTVETPEGVDFQFVIAGPGKRTAAFTLDVIVKVAVVMVAGLLLSILTELTEGVSGLGVGMLLVTVFVMSWLYGAFFETFWNGQTIGKRAQKLRVVRTNGTPIGWYEAFGRNLLLIADAQPMVVLFPLSTAGLLSMAATSKMQRLGDLVFDTMVIDESRDYISRAPGITEGVDEFKRSECTRRSQVPERTLAVIERLFEGDRLISDGRREEIARPLSLALRQWLGYTDPQPDPRNPNTYFAQSPLKHTVFLKRVLKTFADDDLSKAGAIGNQRPIRIEAATAATAASTDHSRWTEEARILQQAAATELDTTSNSAATTSAATSVVATDDEGGDDTEQGSRL
ncbi:MAG: hypothetical protein Fues2KO_17780 [Fuerstiella sp.]